MERLQTGASYPAVNDSQVKGEPISHPPLAEQRRIVAILDEAFAGLDAMRANAENNLQNARDLFDSYLNAVFSEKGEGWVETTIGDQVTLQRGFDITKSEQRFGVIPVVSSGGLKSFHDTPMAKGPGVVIGRKGTLGNTYFLETDFWPHDTTLWVKDFKGNEPRFVFHFFRNLDVIHLDTGTANPALNRNLVHPIGTVWPPIHAQKGLAEKCNVIEVEALRLEALYTLKLAAIAELKQSILQKAFAGELTSSESIAA